MDNDRKIPSNHRDFFKELGLLLARYPVKIQTGDDENIGSCTSICFYEKASDSGTTISFYNFEELDESDCKRYSDPNYELDGDADD